MKKVNLFVLLFIGMGIIASTNLMTNLALGQSNLSEETMENMPKGMKNMSMSLNDIRNETIGIDKTPFS
ncbi:MAG TPA: hypothetical protein VJU13_10225 [Candidatus Nitrosocosmicus sp.]|nr:hypothetical protein [Candidatus Nitrosocosmicus sp.]